MTYQEIEIASPISGRLAALALEISPKTVI